MERVYQIPGSGRAGRGRSIRNVLNLQPEEKVAATLRVERRLDEEGEDVTFAEDAGFVFFATRSGKVKKTSLHDFRHFRKDGVIAIKLEEGNELIYVRQTSGNNEVILVTSAGLSLRFHESQARVMGRVSMGVSGIKPVGDDHLVGMALVEEGATLLVAAQKGLGKRTVFDDYRSQNRGGKGIITMKITDRTGPVISALTVNQEDELMLMTTGGQSIRIRVAEIRETGRNAQGVRLINLKGDEVLQSVARVIPDGDSDGEESDGEEVSEPSEGGDSTATPEGTSPTAAEGEESAESEDAPTDA
jgi:DNA gyrase subunit A